MIISLFRAKKFLNLMKEIKIWKLTAIIAVTTKNKKMFKELEIGFRKKEKSTVV